MRAAPIAAAAIALAAGCGSSPRPAARAPEPGTGAIMDLVPADSPAVLRLDRTILDLAAIWPGGERMRTTLREAIDRAARAPADAAGMHDRFGRELARELVPLDDAALRRVGWLPGESEVVLYGLGLVPVLRVLADGDAARAALTRVAARARLPLTEATWQGHPYVVLPAAAPDEPLVVVVFQRRQVVVALTRTPEAVLPHLVGRGAATPSFTEVWHSRHGDPAAPSKLELGGWVAPEGVAARLRDGSDLAQLGAELPSGCASAVASLLDRSPALSVGYWRDRDDLVVSYTMPLPRELAAPFADGGGIGHWVRRPGTGFQLATSARAGDVVAMLSSFVDEVVAAAHGCGGEARNPLAGVGDLGPFGMMRGGTVLGEISDHELGIAAVMEVDDLPAVWSMLQRALPLGPLPSLGEVRTLPMSTTHQLRLRVEAGAIAASIGPTAFDGLDRLLAAGGRPESLALHVDGEAFAAIQDGDVTFLGRPMGGRDPDDPRLELPWDLVLSGSTLVFRYRWHPAAPIAAPAGE